MRYDGVTIKPQMSHEHVDVLARIFAKPKVAAGVGFYWDYPAWLYVMIHFQTPTGR